jgi:hypothetical protein
VKEIGLLFTPENRALVRSGRKTQTRRGNGLAEFSLATRALLGGRNYWAFFEDCEGNEKVGIKRCPYGNPQAEPVRYYVKEPVQIVGLYSGDIGSGPWAEVIYLDTPDNAAVSVQLTERDFELICCRKNPKGKTSSMFMLKSFARTWLKGVRTWPERLGDMSESDAIAEGIQVVYDKHFSNPVRFAYGWNELNWKGSAPSQPTAADAYRHLWNSINGPDPWNPEQWVWAIEWGAKS